MQLDVAAPAAPAAGDAAVGGAAVGGAAAAATAAAEKAAYRTWRIWGVEFDSRIVQLVVVGTLLLIVAFNNQVIQQEYERFVLEFLVPLAIIVLAWRESPARYGLKLGNWRLGLPIALGGMAIMAIVITYFSTWADFRSYYVADVAGRPGWRLVLDTGLDIMAWEFFCRGWLMYSLARKVGTDAIWLQVIPFALMHLWKPELEQLSTVIGGAFFGLLAWRTGSILYGWLLHWFMLVWILLLVSGAI